MENFRLLHLLRVPGRSPPLPGFHSPSHAGVGGGGPEASAMVAVASSHRPAPSRPPGPATVAGQSRRPPACLCPGEPRGSVRNASPAVGPGEGMVVRDSLDGANGSRVPAATTAPGQQTGSRPSHPPRALDAAQEGSEGDNSGRGCQTTRCQGILPTRGWQHQTGLAVRCCRKDRSWGGCFATPCPSRDSSPVGPHYPRKASFRVPCAAQ